MLNTIPVIVVFSYIFCLPLLATPPTFRDGPRYFFTNKNGFGAKWTTSDGVGGTSTLQTAMSQCGSGGSCVGSSSVITVGTGDGSKFPGGSVINIEGEHMLVNIQAGDVLTVSRGYDFNALSVWEGNLSSITASGGVCVATTAVPSFYTINASITILNGTGLLGVPSVVSGVSSTTINFACAGSTNGTYSGAGLTVEKYPAIHNIGTAIARIDTDAWVRYGPTTSYGTCVKAPPQGTSQPQSVNHFVYVVAQTPGSTIHWQALSTPTGLGPTNCTTPGADTVVSADQVLTLPTLPVAPEPTPPAASNCVGFGAVWNCSDAITYTTDVTAASNCSDLQTKINTAAAADGNLNYRIKIPVAANCVFNGVPPAKSGTNASGTGLIVVESANAGSLPVYGTRLDPVAQAANLATLYTPTAVPVWQFAASAHHYLFRGLIITADPAKNSASFGGDFSLVTTFNGNSNDFDVNLTPNHIAFEQVYLWCPDYNAYCKGTRWHGQYLAFMDSKVAPVYGTKDQGAIQTDGYNSQYVQVKNNYLSGSMSNYYQSDNSINPSDVTVIQNTMEKPRKWNIKDADYIQNATQAVASFTNNTSTLVTTTNQNDLSGGQPVAFSGGTGNYAVFNYHTWSVALQNMTITCTSGTCTVVTSSAHGLTTGQFVYLGGGHFYPCTNFYTGASGASSITVTNATTFTVVPPNTVADFSTVSGLSCQLSNPTIVGPVFPITVSTATTFIAFVNSTGFTGTAPTTVYYPHARIIKNALEFKTGVRALITGNIIHGSWSQDQSGQGFTMTVRGQDSPSGWPIAQGANNVIEALTISDVDITNNQVTDVCSMLSVLGANPSDPTTPMQRLRMQNNAGFNISINSSGGATCAAAPVGANGSYNDLTIDHNTIQSTQGREFDEDNTSFFPYSGSVYITNNILNASSVPTNGATSGAGMINGQPGAGSNWSWLTASFTRNVQMGCGPCVSSADPWNFQRQTFSASPGPCCGSTAFYQGAAYWPNSQAGVGYVGAMAVTGASATSPIVLTVNNTATAGDQVFVSDVGGNDGANGGPWYVGTGSDATHIILAGSIKTSAYTSGGTVTCWSGACATLPSLALAGTSNYLSTVAHVDAAPPPAYGTAGVGFCFAADGVTAATCGANIQAIINATTGAGSSAFSSVMRNVTVRGHLVTH